MAFDIPGFDNIEFNISSGKGKKITIAIPPVDCLYPTDIAAIQNEAEKQHIDNNSVEIMRLFLLYFNNTQAKKDAIGKLVHRQLVEIDRIWSQESGIQLGESLPSTNMPSEGTPNSPTPSE
nr:MAG TPA: hypothetical protein [Caudoviricetes sp.]